MEDLVSISLDGSGLLLIGSGFTFGATNAEGTNIPNVTRLLAILNAPFPDDPYLRYQSAAERFLMDPKLGHAALYTRLRREFQVQTYKPWHANVLAIPWHRIYTTNYDNLIERVLADKGIRFRTHNAAKDDKLYEPQLPNIVHLNGSFDAVTNINFDALIRLTDASYIAARFSTTPYFNRLRDEMRAAGSVFVVGHSLSELDLAKVIGGDPTFREKTVVITGPDASSEERFSLGKFGDVQAIGVERFGEIVTRIRQHYNPRTVPKKIYTAYEYPPGLTHPKRATDRDRFNLYVHGIFKPEHFLVQSDAEPGSLYSVFRLAINHTVQALADRPHLVFAHGNLGSGKTVFVQQCATTLARRGFRTIVIDRQSEFLLGELDHIVETASERIILVFEHYERFISDIRSVLDKYKSPFSVLCTSRTLIHHAKRAEILRMNRANLPTLEWNLNVLNDREVGALSRVLMSDELRGAFHRQATPENVAAVIAGPCEARIGLVILHILRSPHVKQKLEDAFRSGALSGRKKEFVLVCFILRILGHVLRKAEIEEAFFSVGEFGEMAYGEMPFSEILRFDDRDFLLCSIATGEFFVTEVFDAREVRAALTRITKSCYARRGVAVYDEIYKQCIQRGAIRDLFSRAEADEELITFYDEIKGAGAVKDNPYFWLQYAIARWQVRERGLVDGYLVKAREVGKRREGFSPFQVDNFEAIVRLEAQREGIGFGKLVSDVEFAVAIINRQMEDDRTANYSLRLIGVLADALEGRQADLNAKDIGHIRRELRDLVRRLPNSWVYEEYPREGAAAEERLSRIWQMRS